MGAQACSQSTVPHKELLFSHKNHLIPDPQSAQPRENKCPPIRAPDTVLSALPGRYRAKTVGSRLCGAHEKFHLLIYTPVFPQETCHTKRSLIQWNNKENPS